ncbi:hypothetical protein BOO86_12725 [Mycobacterium sp. CBMA 234]|uniref:hypothetical protein n=1 Tax=Mycolicibacterium sp. CBMA 234 TaxID=1918495 RepID=UPI00139082E7|nr:hypothetical protein [Mycolicibacterium sp. CBMA 234]MUL65334.1 hypothetical protein [Mycolicibacterium sp. CBMA 234]
MTHSGFGADAFGDLPVDLRLLAQALIDKIDPVVRLSVAMLADGENPSDCQQIWCPLCALAALANDEQHPLLTAIAEHSTSLLDAVRAALADQGPVGPNPEPPTDPSGPGGKHRQPAEPDEPPSGPGRYQPIPVSVEE